MITKPMLAEKIKDLNKVKFPVLATPKFDGIRCLIIDGNAVTRTFKPIPNKYIREKLKSLPSGLDGELVIANKEYNDTQSGIMSHDGEPDFEYHVFDYVLDLLECPYNVRVKDLEEVVKDLPDFVKLVLPTELNNKEELEKYEEDIVGKGFEGIIVRSVDGPYKCGRSTVKQGWLLKLKRFEDSEALVLGFTEGFLNKNKAEVDELGHTKRSSHKANMVLAGTLGSFQVKDIHDDSLFDIGTGIGLTHKLKQEIWDNRKVYLGKIVKYKYQKVGRKDLPRIPSFLGFRDRIDL